MSTRFYKNFSRWSQYSTCINFFWTFLETYLGTCRLGKITCIWRHKYIFVAGPSERRRTWGLVLIMFSFFHKKAKLIYDLKNLLISILIIPKEMVKKIQNVLAAFSFKNYARVPDYLVNQRRLAGPFLKDQFWGWLEVTFWMKWETKR